MGVVPNSASPAVASKARRFALDVLNLQKQKPFSIVAHRGNFSGNVLQNSIDSAKLALLRGADVVEIDINKSLDGTYYLFHEKNEQILFHDPKPLSELTDAEISDLTLYNAIGDPSGKRLTTLEAMLAWLPDNVCLNIDRSWPYFKDEAFAEVIGNSGKVKQLLFKAPANKENLQAFIYFVSQLPSDVNPYFMAIISNTAQVNSLKSYTDINLIAYEIVAENWPSPLLEDSMIERLKQDVPLLMVNLLRLSGDRYLSGPYHDEAWLTDEGLDLVPLVDLGINMIQTDWPDLLSQYRHRLSQ